MKTLKQLLITFNVFNENIITEAIKNLTVASAHLDITVVLLFQLL